MKRERAPGCLPERRAVGGVRVCLSAHHFVIITNEILDP